MSRESDFVSNIGEQSDVEIPFQLVPDESTKMLNEKREFDYRNHREKFVRWLLREGKEPEEKMSQECSWSVWARGRTIEMTRV